MVKRSILLVLSQSQRDLASDLVIAPSADGGTAIRYRIENVWHDWTPAGLAWPSMVSELGGLAGIRDEPYPKAGIIYVAYSGIRMRWQIEMKGPTAECSLRNLGGDMV